MNFYFIGGGFGTDAPGWYIGSDGKIHKVPGGQQALDGFARGGNIRDTQRSRVAGGPHRGRSSD